MTYLYDNNLISKNNIELPALSPYIQSGAVLETKMLYLNGQILWFEKHVQKIIHSAGQLDLYIGGNIPDSQAIMALIDKNKLSGKTALIKILCEEEPDGCHFLVFATPYQIPAEPITAALHKQPHTSSLRKLPLQRYEDYYWQDHYARKYGTQQILFTNFKQQIISANHGNIIAIRDKNLYFVHQSQPYYEHFIQEEIIKNAGKLGIKKVLDKNKGFAQSFIQRTDELLYINDLLNIIPITGYYNQNGTFFELGSKGWAEKIRNFFTENI